MKLKEVIQCIGYPFIVSLIDYSVFMSYMPLPGFGLVGQIGSSLEDSEL